MTQFAKPTDMTAQMLLVLPVLAFVAGLGTAQLISTADGVTGFDQPQAETTDHPRRSARYAPPTDGTGTEPEDRTTSQVRGDRLTDTAETGQWSKMEYGAVEANHSSRARSVARD